MYIYILKRNEKGEARTATSFYVFGCRRTTRCVRRQRAALHRAVSNPPLEALLAISKPVAGEHRVFGQEAHLESADVVVVRKHGIGAGGG